MKNKDRIEVLESRVEYWSRILGGTYEGRDRDAGLINKVNTLRRQVEGLQRELDPGRPGYGDPGVLARVTELEEDLALSERQVSALFHRRQEAEAHAGQHLKSIMKLADRCTKLLARALAAEAQAEKTENELECVMGAFRYEPRDVDRLVEVVREWTPGETTGVSLSPHDRDALREALAPFIGEGEQ